MLCLIFYSTYRVSLRCVVDTKKTWLASVSFSPSKKPFTSLHETVVFCLLNLLKLTYGNAGSQQLSGGNTPGSPFQGREREEV